MTVPSGGQKAKETAQNIFGQKKCLSKRSSRLQDFWEVTLFENSQQRLMFVDVVASQTMTKTHKVAGRKERHVCQIATTTLNCPILGHPEKVLHRVKDNHDVEHVFHNVENL